jgi:hypothetical protein
VEKAALPVNKELAAVLRCLASLALEDEKRVGLAQADPLEPEAEKCRAAPVPRRGVAPGLVLTVPCGAVPRSEDGQVDLQLVGSVLLEQRVADPKLEAVPALTLVEPVLVEPRRVSPV